MSVFKINVGRIAFLNSNMHVINCQIKYRLTELKKTPLKTLNFSAGDVIFPVSIGAWRLCLPSQVAQTLFVIYIRDSIALRFELFKRM